MAHVSSCLIALLLCAAGDETAPEPREATATPDPPAESVSADSADPTFESVRNSVRLREIPDIPLEQRPPIDAKRIATIQQLITHLAEVDHPHYGYSGTLEGWGFLPVEGQMDAMGYLVTEHRLAPSETLRELVAIGPDALPFLLESLSDGTPTRVNLEPTARGEFFIIGGLRFARELWPSVYSPHFNPLNPGEANVLRAVPLDEDLGDADRPSQYTLTIGDLCFVAIGQIVGREYLAARYQRTAVTVINSPTHDPVLADRVRRIWTSDDPRGMLFESLLRDFCIEGKELDDYFDSPWGLVNHLQCSAALRLLYYYPEEAAPLIVERLRSMDVAGGFDRIDERNFGNRVYSDEFIQSVAWSDQPEIRAALTDLFVTMTDLQLLVATAPGVDDPTETIIPGKFQAVLDSLPPVEDSGFDRGYAIFGDGYQILLAWTEHAPGSAEAAMLSYLQNGEFQRLQTACAVMEDSSPEWETRFLRPFLDDTRNLESWSYRDMRFVDGQSVPVRLCDLAASTLAEEDETLSFQLEGTIEEVDRQIAVMREELDRRLSSE